MWKFHVLVSFVAVFRAVVLKGGNYASMSDANRSLFGVLLDTKRNNPSEVN